MQHLMLFYVYNNMEQKETKKEYLDRLIKMGDEAVSNIDNIYKDMKKDGIIAFCNKCGCNIYKNKKHKC